MSRGAGSSVSRRQVLVGGAVLLPQVLLRASRVGAGVADPPSTETSSPGAPGPPGSPGSPGSPSPAGSASVVGGTSYAATVLSRGPVGYWRLGQASGTIFADASGSERHGVAHGTVRLAGAGALRSDDDRSVTLDGRRSYIEVPSDPAFSQPTSGQGLSVEVWLRPDSLSLGGTGRQPYIHWLGKGGPGRYEWALRLYDRRTKTPNRISAYLFSPSGGLGAGAFFQDRLVAGEWIHVVACFEPGSADSPGRPGVRLYKNGELRQGPSSSGARYRSTAWHVVSAPGTAPVRFGTRDLQGFLVGGLDEIAIYPRVLQPEEVKEHYRIGVGTLPVPASSSSTPARG